MNPRFKFFDQELCLKVTNKRGMPIWDIDSTFLRWMLEKGREGMGALEVDIIRACLAEKGRLHALYKKSREEKAQEKATDSKFCEEFGIPPEEPEGGVYGEFS